MGVITITTPAPRVELVIEVVTETEARSPPGRRDALAPHQVARAPLILPLGERAMGAVAIGRRDVLAPHLVARAPLVLPLGELAMGAVAIGVVTRIGVGSPPGHRDALVPRQVAQALLVPLPVGLLPVDLVPQSHRHQKILMSRV